MTEEVTMEKYVTRAVSRMINNQNEANPSHRGSWPDAPISQQETERLAWMIWKQTEAVIHQGEIVVQRESLATAHLGTLLRDRFIDSLEAMLLVNEKTVPFWIQELLQTALPLTDWIAVAEPFITHHAGSDKIHNYLMGNEAQEEESENES